LPDRVAIVKPVVGVTVSLDRGIRLREGVDYAYLKRSYGHAVARAGGVPVLLTPEAAVEDALAVCDGLVLSGGDDLPAQLPSGGPTPAPRVSGGQPELPERIDWERALIDAARAAGTPLLGVCYGMQLVNLHLGGTLRERLEAGSVDHGGAGRVSEHTVRLRAGHPAFRGLPPEPLVASSHRQGIGRVAPGLEVLAEAPDGVIEALGGGSELGVDWLGVEWHPEADATGDAIYGWLVACATVRRGSRGR
jgi:putative glutamine amidotransferase